MKIIEQSHEILRLDSLKQVELAGRTCYKSEDKIGCTKDSCPMEVDLYGLTCEECPHHTSDKFSRMLIKRGHEAMLEHAVASVKFITNRGVTHELVRHRLCAFGQESTRYVNCGGDDIQFIRPVWCPATIIGSYDEIAFWPGEDEATEGFVYFCAKAEQQYQRLINLGWQPQQAREVLPNSLKTEIVVTANFREWRHIFKLRAIGTTGKPHPQMQALMLPVLREFAAKCPAVFEDIAAMEKE